MAAATLAAHASASLPRTRPSSCGKWRGWGQRSARFRQIGRAANIGGGVDYAIIRFKIPGFDDMTGLPQVLAIIGMIGLVGNRWYYPETFNSQEVRLITEALAVLLAVCCWALPWMNQRLDEAVRRKVTSRTVSQEQDSLQTLAIDGAFGQASRVEFAWLTATLLRLTNADGLAIWKDGKVVCTRGLLRQLPGFSQGPAAVLSSLSAQWQSLPDAGAAADGYCATKRGLDNFPRGLLPRCVFPGNTESAIVKPIPGGGLLVMWTALPRAFDRLADRLWVVQAAAKLGEALSAEGTADGGATRTATLETCYEEDVPGFGAAPSTAASRDPFARFDSQIRFSPGTLGLIALGILGWNRVVLMGETQALIKGIDPVQSRMDLVAGVLAVTLVLQSMLWLSETPEDPKLEDTSGWENVKDITKVGAQLGPAATAELFWMWDTLKSCTRIVSMAVFWEGSCVMQAGLFREAESGGVPPHLGPLCETVMSSRKGRYFAQLKNYPAKEEFLDYLPERTQGLVLTPLCPVPDGPAAGIFVFGVDSVRGVGKIDQAWLGALAEKVAVSLAAAPSSSAPSAPSSEAAPVPAAA